MPFQFTEKVAAPLTTSTLDFLMERAADPEACFDQKGRVWSRWHTLVPGDFRICARCEARCSSGYVLQPELRITICSKHVRRWV